MTPDRAANPSGLCGVLAECAYRDLADDVSDTVFELTLDGATTFVNAAGRLRFGYTAEAFPNLESLIGHLSPDEQDRARRLLNRVLSGEGSGRAEEFLLHTTDGTPVPAAIRARPIRRNGHIAGVRCIATDISDRKRAEAADQESARWFDRAFNASPAPTVLSDPITERFLDANSRFAELTEYDREELIGHTQDELAIWTDEAARTRYATTLRQMGSTRDFETTIRTKGGAIRHVLASAEVLLRRGQPCVVSVYYDISAQKQAQVQQLQSQKLEAIGQLAAGIAHEINTPIQFVGDNLRFLQDSFATLLGLGQQREAFIEAVRRNEPAPPLLQEIDAATRLADIDFVRAEVPDALSQSLDGVARVARIVRAMKEFAHPDAGEKAPSDLNAAIDSTVTVARNEWKYVADVSLDLEPNLPLVPCLVGELNQVMLNLLVNAAHAIADVVKPTGGKGQLTISTRQDGGWVEIRVTDTGTGIPEAVRPRVFDPFFTTKGVGKGTGQGLAIARTVVEKKHGGTLSFETEVGKGTTFIIRLPLRSSGQV
jgi:two-component system, NtrC family, sensor kinase